MTNTEAISLIEQLKAEIEWDLSLEYQTALDKAISSLERDEIGLNETIKQIHDGVYAEAYEKGRKDAIEEYHLKLLNCKTTKVKSIHDAEIWVEFKRQSTNIAEELKEQENG